MVTVTVTYTASSTLLGTGTVTAMQIGRWFAANNAAVSLRFCLDLGTTIREESGAAGVNADLVAAQIAHETGFWSSDYALHRNNPSGLGAVNDDPDQALTFVSPRAGVHAMVAHLLTYCLGAANPWRADDPRFDAAAVAGYLGCARVLSDLDGRWAWPGKGYGAAIARLANELLSEGAALVDGDDDGNVEFCQSANYTAGRDGRPVERIVLHTTEGGYDGAVTWLLGAAAGSDNTNSSTHYIVRADGSEQRQLVREADTAWTVGNWEWNLRTISIEQEGYASGINPSDPQGLGGFSDGLYQAVGELVGRIAGRWGIPLDREHVIGHKDVPYPNDHTDPGPFYDFDRLLAIARGHPGSAAAPVAAPSAGEHAQAETVRRDSVTGCTLIGGFRAYVEWLESAVGASDALLLLGRPITDERVEVQVGDDGTRSVLTVQWFERARLERHPGVRPERWDVLLTRLGAAAVR